MLQSVVTDMMGSPGNRYVGMHLDAYGCLWMLMDAYGCLWVLLVASENPYATPMKPL